MNDNGLEPAAAETLFPELAAALLSMPQSSSPVPVSYLPKFVDPQLAAIVLSNHGAGGARFISRLEQVANALGGATPEECERLTAELWLAPAAREQIREEIARTGGRECSFQVEWDDATSQFGRVKLYSRGSRTSCVTPPVTTGLLCLHNHPSGSTEPSDPDLDLAAKALREGAGFGIITNCASRLYLVAEPRARRPASPTVLIEASNGQEI